MKYIYTIIIALLISFSAYCQLPNTFKYQAVIRGSEDQVLVNENVSLTLKILPASGAEVYSETHNVKTNQFGLVNLEIGLDDAAKFSKIDWSLGGYQLLVNLGDKLIGTGVILAIPYAIHAETTDSITGDINETDPIYSGSQATKLTTDNINNLSNLSGANTGDQDLSGYATIAALNNKIDTISGKVLSTNDFTAEDKAKLSAISGNNTGDQKLSGLATKAYVDLLTQRIENLMP